jgi:tryptophanyl-tRNA synthetase
LVPIGEDQKQHLEITRDIAQKFNNTFSETFVLPEPHIGQTGARVMSLQNPATKMSKSDKNQNGVVYITDTDDVIRKKFTSAVTDSGNKIEFNEEEKPGISNLLNIFAAMAEVSIGEAVEQFSSLTSYAPFKQVVADAAIAKFGPMREKYNESIRDREYLLSVLNTGKKDAQRRADRMITKVYRKVGFAME